jgi:hypothetical protein
VCRTNGRQHQHFESHKNDTSSKEGGIFFCFRLVLVVVVYLFFVCVSSLFNSAANS